MRTYQRAADLGDIKQAVKEALGDMDVVMDDDKMGKFVTKTVTDEIYS